MKIQIRYYTRSGNTEKLAKAIAEAVGEAAESVAFGMSERADVLFLGCSYYAFDMDPSVKKFLTDHKDKIGKLVVFGTSAMMKSMKKPMKRVTAPLGILLADEEFHCKGQFKFANKNRPDSEDLAAVAEFAKWVIENE